MARKLNIQEKYEERKFIITSMIRLHAMMELDENALSSMLLCAEHLRKSEGMEATITDDTLFHLFEEWLR